MRKLRGLWPYILHHKWPMIGGIIALILTNFFQILVPKVVGIATDAMKAHRGTQEDYVAFAVTIVCLTVLLGSFRYFMRDWIVGASREIEFEFRNDVFAKLQSLTPSFYDVQRTGDLMSKATNDVDAVRMFLGPGILQFFNSVIIFPLALARMISISPLVTLVTMIPLLALPVIVNYYGNRVHKRFRAVQDHYSVISAMVQENLAGMRVVKAFTQEQSQMRRFGDLNRDFIDLNIRLARLQAAFFPMLRMLTGLSVVLLIWFGGMSVVKQGPHSITLGQLIEFSLIQMMLFWPMMALGWTVSLMQRGAASMERIEEVLDLQPDVLVVPDAKTNAEITRGEIEFRDLSFAYAPGLPLVLQDINIKLSAGNRLGIVGHTGSGKSTIAAVLSHQYRIERGKLFFDGSDINDIQLKELRDKLAVVFQETFLFSDSIENNIAFGTQDANRARIEAVAQQAHIADEIVEFPKGYETMLGERGINLSGGQKQRTAIARALIRDPRILVLDDALSAVDTETEERIIESLKEASEGRTTVIIAHRISAVMHCDEIIVLAEGRIVERGTHDQLVDLGGLYANLYEKQLLAEAVDAE